MGLGRGGASSSIDHAIAAIGRFSAVVPAQSQTHPWRYTQNPIDGAMATASTLARPQYAMPSPRRAGGRMLVRYAADADEQRRPDDAVDEHQREQQRGSP